MYGQIAGGDGLGGPNLVFQAVGHLVEGLGQGADFVPAVDGQAALEAPFAHFANCLYRPSQRPGNASDQKKGQGQGQGCRHRDRCNEGPQGFFVAGEGSGITVLAVILRQLRQGLQIGLESGKILFGAGHHAGGHFGPDVLHDLDRRHHIGDGQSVLANGEIECLGNRRFLLPGEQVNRTLGKAFPDSGHRILQRPAGFADSAQIGRGLFQRRLVEAAQGQDPLLSLAQHRHELFDFAVHLRFGLLQVDHVDDFVDPGVGGEQKITGAGRLPIGHELLLVEIFHGRLLPLETAVGRSGKNQHQYQHDGGQGKQLSADPGVQEKFFDHRSVLVRVTG